MNAQTAAIFTAIYRNANDALHRGPKPVRHAHHDNMIRGIHHLEAIIAEQEATIARLTEANRRLIVNAL